MRCEAQPAHRDSVAACLACALGNFGGPDSLPPFSFGMGLRRTLLIRVGLGVSEETRGDGQGANCCRFSLRR